VRCRGCFVGSCTGHHESGFGARLRGKEMEAHVASEVALASEEYRIARTIGAPVLVVGLALTTTASFI
jgi:hypothetical protein